jgi:hypothetical protein
MRARGLVVVIGLLIGVVLCVTVPACKKTEVTPEELDARAQAAVAAKTPPVAPAEAAAAEAGSSMKAVSYAGTYSVAMGKMYVPDQKDWSSVKFKNDETKLLGDGEMTLAVDPSGRVSGGSETGPLGASVLDGTSDGQTLTATVRRKDPADEGLTGTLVAKITGDALVGTMKLAESNAAVVREAKLDAKAKK